MTDAAPTTLWLAGAVRSPVPGADALVSTDGAISWVGPRDQLGATEVGRTVDLGAAVVLPGFVDAHVHTTSTGVMLDGLDLHAANSLTEALDLLRRHAQQRRGGVVLGTGWDESRWPERRPPTAAELDRASWGGVVYLARADVHSAVASSALLATCPEAASEEGWAGEGLVRLEAHHTVRRAAYSALSAADVRRAQRRTLDEAAAKGIVSVHEMSGPEIAGEADLAALLRLCAEEPAVEVVPYWAALGDVATAVRLDLRGAGGDLFCDGSLGSRTAALHEPYADAPETTGHLRYGVEEISDHIFAAVRAGRQPDFHVIGDAAVDTVLTAYERAAALLGEGDGLAVLARSRPRLEHAELASADAVERMAVLGITASVQPAFDAAWGGAHGMYAARLGAERAARLNPFAEMVAAGVRLAFGSDTPVTGLDPWGALRAAVAHQTPAHRVDVETAFAAHTTGGRWAAGQDDEGVLRSGAPATFAVWDRDGLATLGEEYGEHRMPQCLRTVVRGRTLYDAEGAGQ